MIYVSASQVIEENINNKTEWGLKLKASHSAKTVESAEGVNQDYLPVHYDLSLVLECLQQTIMMKRQGEKFVLLEGLCNTSKLSDQNDKL